ncbi:MAG: hypothetical protein NTZ12_05360, partial [Candidatus Aminicenantes bacterium]|nr:hypothetical protein [Candidatus Aminicenantes bacterium]
MKRKLFIFLLLLVVMVMADENVRPFLNTGPWYPSDPAQLRQMLDGFFDSLPQPGKDTRVRGIIV